MLQPGVNRFHPKRWTALTWLAILVWSWGAFPLNYPSSRLYTRDANTGELTVSARFKSLSEIPYPVGWPLPYITPSDRPLVPQLAVAVGAPLPPPPPPLPSSVSPLAMVANFILIVSAISAVVYLLQRFLFQFSLVAVFAVMSAYPLYIALARLIVMLAGYNAVRWYGTGVYFSPIVIALAARYSLYPRIDWEKLRLKLKPRPRSFDDYDSPDDAMAAAAKLDTRGDWDASIDLYRHAAHRWPEHTEYIQKCVDRITEKQALAQA